MIRTLLIIAGAGLVLAIACMVGATALGGADMARHGWAWTFRDGDQNIRIERVITPDAVRAGPTVTRALAWTGGQALVLSDGLDADYVQGAAAGVVVTGPQALVDRVRLENGRLSLADGDEEVTIAWDRSGVRARTDRDDLRVVVTAPDVSRFEVNGSGDLTIRGYDQSSLTLIVSGSGDVEADGRADSVDVQVSGSGDVDLDRVTVRDAKVAVAGSGGVRVGPSNEANVSISGSGDVDLSRRPARLTSEVSGSGEIS